MSEGVPVGVVMDAKEKSELKKSFKSWVPNIVVYAIGISLFTIYGSLQDSGTTGAQTAVLVGLGFVAVYSVWKVPTFIIFIVMMLAGSSGGVFALVAAPVVILLSAHAHQLHRGGRRTLREWRPVLGVAAVAAALSFLVANLVIGGRGASDDAGGTTRAPRSIDFGWLDWLSERLGIREGSELIDVAAGGRPPEETTNWLLLAALVAGVLLFIVATALLIRWFKRRDRSAPNPAAPATAWSMERLERIGESVGRPRQSHEGAIAYADALAEYTGDARLRAAGPLISARMFDPRVVTANDAGQVDEAIQDTLGPIELQPPQAPPAPVQPTEVKRTIGDRWGSAVTRLNGISVRSGLISGTVLGLLLLTVWYVATNTSSATDLPEQLAFADDSTGFFIDDEPEILELFAEQLALSPDEFRSYQTCTSWTYSDGLVGGFSQSGIEHPISGAAIVSTVDLDGSDVSWSITTPTVGIDTWVDEETGERYFYELLEGDKQAFSSLGFSGDFIDASLRTSVDEQPNDEIESGFVQYTGMSNGNGGVLDSIAGDVIDDYGLPTDWVVDLWVEDDVVQNAAYFGRNFQFDVEVTFTLTTPVPDLDQSLHPPTCN